MQVYWLRVISGFRMYPGPGLPRAQLYIYIYGNHICGAAYGSRAVVRTALAASAERLFPHVFFTTHLSKTLGGTMFAFVHGHLKHYAQVFSL